MDGRVVVGLLATLPLAGCANLQVKKVAEYKRLSGEDEHVKGFRYYLSRPYVVVRAPILVSEVVTTYAVHQPPKCPNELGKEQVTRINSSSGALESVSEQELKHLRRLIQPAQPIQQVAHGHGQRPTLPAAPVVVIPPKEEEKPPIPRLAEAAVDTPKDVSIRTAQVTGNETDDNAASGGRDPLSIPTITKDAELTDRETAVLTGDIRVIFLPDLDEQYAVHNCNFLSKSAYTLHFKDGWELTDVGGEFDSVAVPLEILNFIDTAIEAAKSVAVAEVNREGQANRYNVHGLPPHLKTGEHKFYQLTTSTYLKPGVYRINKPWEIDPCAGETGCGLLVKLGLATFETQRLVPDPDVKALATGLSPKCCVWREAKP
jgi:hypothetical protein